MEWMETLRQTVDYLEAHLLEENAAERAAQAVWLSPLYLQKGFKLVTGYSMAEYVRNRRLYLAGLEAIAGRVKVIDLAYKYGYDTPESFSKAFSRFHGVSPAQLQKIPERLVPFLPLQITLSIRGGQGMDYNVEKVDEFQLIGVERAFSPETSYQEIPKFWDEFISKHCEPLWKGKTPETALEK
nr:AraC family transcriptional regulator [Oscillospiraceae bacterium]